MKKRTNKSILYIDDEKQNLEVFNYAFWREYNITLAESPQEGLNILQAQNQEIDIIISDQKMPKMTGLELMEIIAEKYPKLHRVIVTGYSHEGDLEKALSSKLVHFIVEKPWRREELEKAFDIKDDSKIE